MVTCNQYLTDNSDHSNPLNGTNLPLLTVNANAVKKKGKAKGKARRATKSREELNNDTLHVKKNVELRIQRQRLQISNSNNNNDQDDEDALLEEAINLAAAEKEKLDAAAKNDERCDHGLVPLPRGHVCALFVHSFLREFIPGSKTVEAFENELENALIATKKRGEVVMSNPDMLKWVVSHFLAEERTCY